VAMRFRMSDELGQARGARGDSKSGAIY